MGRCNGEFQGETLKPATTSPRQKDIPTVIQALIESLQKRFEDIEEGILQATRLVDLTTWPPTQEEAAGWWNILFIFKSTQKHKIKTTNFETNIFYFADFGDEYLSAVIDHFKDILEASEVDLSAAESEWTELKKVLYSQ